MTVEVQCRECGGVLRAKDDSIGQTLPCPKCSAPLVVDGVRKAARTRGGGTLPLVLSLIALAVAIFAACWAYFRDPLGKGLRAYDFSTPAAAVRSQVEMQVNKDFRARLEFEALHGAAANREFLDTLKVHKTSDYDRSGEPEIAKDRDFESLWKVVFLTHRVNERERHTYRFYRKHKESGIWFPGYASVFNIQGELRKEIDDWNRQFAGANRRPFVKQLAPKKMPPRGK